MLGEANGAPAGAAPPLEPPLIADSGRRGSPGAAPGRGGGAESLSPPGGAPGAAAPPVDSPSPGARGRPGWPEGAGGRRGGCAVRGEGARLAFTRASRASHLKRLSIGVLAQRPGLSGLPGLLGIPPASKIPVLSCVGLNAEFDSGTRRGQLVRAAPSFWGSQSLDFVLYAVGDHLSQVCVREVQVLLRVPGRDLAVVCEMAPAAAVPGCPFTARRCTRLQWLLRPGEQCFAVRVVPVSCTVAWFTSYQILVT